MFISQKCFKDKHMISIIRRNNQIGTCDFCDLENTYVIDLEKFCEEYKKELYQIFELYEYEYKDRYLPQDQLQKDLEGLVKLRENIELKYDNLLNLLQKHWDFFDLDVISEQKAYEVLVYWYNKINQYKPLEINDLKDKHWFDMRYKYWGYFVKEDWEFIRLNMTHSYRYNPEKIPKINFDLDEIFSFKVFDELAYYMEKGKVVYRGRIKENIDRKFKKREMLIPPLNIKSIGRANPVGINYLYVADSPETAISEVRAWKGSTISIATLEFKEDLVIVDLTWVEPLESLLDKEPYNNISLLDRIQYCELANLLCETLSKPINPRESDLEYIFTQYLCERIRAFGECFDGIMFNSSLCEGKKFVLFSDDKIRVKSINDYTVDKIEYKVSKIKDEKI